MKILEVSQPEIASIPPTIGCVLGYAMGFHVKVDKSFDSEKESFLTAFKLMENMGSRFRTVLNLGEFRVKVDVDIDEDFVGRNPILSLKRLCPERLSDTESIIPFRAELQIDTLAMGLLRMSKSRQEKFVFSVSICPLEQQEEIEGQQLGVELPLA